MPGTETSGGTSVDFKPWLKSRLAQSNLLATVPGVAHGVTSRVEGAGRAYGNVGFGAPRDREDAWIMRHAWCGALGLNAEQLATAHQVHGADVLAVSSIQAGQGAHPDSSPVGVADALITRERGVVLLTLHADCLPILMIDPDTPAVAAVHAGWRGTVLDVSGATVREMVRIFGSRPERMMAFLGPAIGSCCYEIGDEVVDAWQRQALRNAGHALTPGPRRQHLNLVAANRLLLHRVGLREDRIDASPICTRCSDVEWFSHRGQGAETGRFGAMIALIGARS